MPYLKKKTFLKAEIGQIIVFRHSRRAKEVTGIVDDITIRMRGQQITYHVITRTYDGLPFRMNAEQEKVLRVLE